MYFSNDKIVRKNFFITSIIALPFGRQQPLLGLFHFFSVLKRYNLQFVKMNLNKKHRFKTGISDVDKDTNAKCSKTCNITQTTMILGAT